MDIKLCLHLLGPIVRTGKQEYTIITGEFNRQTGRGPPRKYASLSLWQGYLTQELIKNIQDYTCKET